MSTLSHRSSAVPREPAVANDDENLVDDELKLPKTSSLAIIILANVLLQVL